MQNCRGFVAIIRDQILREIWREIWRGTYEGLHEWRSATPMMFDMKASVYGKGGGGAPAMDGECSTSLLVKCVKIIEARRRIIQKHILQYYRCRIGVPATTFRKLTF
jgi:hypothetical protein